MADNRQQDVNATGNLRMNEALRKEPDKKPFDTFP
jgi:hypothetical protein